MCFGEIVTPRNVLYQSIQLFQNTQHKKQKRQVNNYLIINQGRGSYNESIKFKLCMLSDRTLRNICVKSENRSSMASEI